MSFDERLRKIDVTKPNAATLPVESDNGPERHRWIQMALDPLQDALLDQQLEMLAQAFGQGACFD